MANSTELDVLPGADGSAKFSSQGITVLATVNGPLEVQRRDELPDEATIDVSVRPSAGLAGIRERLFESLIHKTLSQVIRTKQHPRTLIQVTLQIMAIPDSDSSTPGRPNQAAHLLYLLPPLLNTAMLALLCSSIPLSTTFTSTCVAADMNDQILVSPSVKTFQSARSIHVVVYSSQGELLLNESEGSFNVNTWNSCLEAGKGKCLEDQTDSTRMTNTSEIPLLASFRQAIEGRIQQSEQWKQQFAG